MNKRRRIRSPSGSDSDTPAGELKNELQELKALVDVLMSDRRGSKNVGNYIGKNNILPEFVPEDGKMVAEKWVDLIEQIANINRWDENTTIYNMQAKLGGLAKEWFASLKDFKLSWAEWKVSIVRAFPEATDFNTLLQQMQDRKKR